MTFYNPPPMSRFLYSLLALLLPLICDAAEQAQFNSSALNPVTSVCARWQHQSVVKNGRLYIDGGIETFKNATTNATGWGILGVNEYLIQIGMNETWDWRTNITEEVFPKNNNPSSGIMPYTGVIRGTMFQGPPDDPNVYTFGGTSYMGNTSFQGWEAIQSVQHPLWSLNTSTMVWDTYASSLVTVPNYGASAEAPDQGLGFYLNGQLDAGTAYVSEHMGLNESYDLEGMIVINLTSQTLTNISTPGLENRDYPRVGGSMQYLSALGRSGLLLAMGGMSRNFTISTNFTNKATMAKFDTVDIFDIASYLDNPASNGTWYSQTTTGDIPEGRIDSCVVAASAPDNSSHNIYMYGGRDPILNVIYDDIYTLSIPSFTWKKQNQGNSPRWGHTCHVVGNRQMLTVGGSLNTTLNGCDWEYKGVAIFDMAKAVWTSFVFEPDGPAYQVPQSIYAVIGGTENGGATLTKPVKGYDSTALAAVISATRTSAPEPAGSPTGKPSSHSDTGTIVGAVVGSVCGVALLAALLLLYLRYRRKRNAERAAARRRHELQDAEKAEMEGSRPPREAGGKQLPSEMYAGHGRSEADPDVTTPAELPADPIAELESPSPGDDKKLGDPMDPQQVDKKDTLTEEDLREERVQPRWVEVRPEELQEGE